MNKYVLVTWDGELWDMVAALYPTEADALKAALPWMEEHNIFSVSDFDDEQQAWEWWVDEGQHEDFSIGCLILEAPLVVS